MDLCKNIIEEKLERQVSNHEDHYHEIVCRIAQNYKLNGTCETGVRTGVTSGIVNIMVGLRLDLDGLVCKNVNRSIRFGSEF